MVLEKKQLQVSFQKFNMNINFNFKEQYRLFLHTIEIYTDVISNK